MTTCSSSFPGYFINRRDGGAGGNVRYVVSPPEFLTTTRDRVAHLCPLVPPRGVVDRGRHETHMPVLSEFVCPLFGGITPAAALSKGGRCAAHTIPISVHLPP